MTQPPEAGDHAPVIEQSDREFAAMLTEMLNKADGVGRRTDKYLDGSWDGREVVRAAAIYRMRLRALSPAPSQGDVELRVARALRDSAHKDTAGSMIMEEFGEWGEDSDFLILASAAIAAMPVSAGYREGLEAAAKVADDLAHLVRSKKTHERPLTIDTNEAWRRVEDACLDIAAAIRLSDDDGKEGR